MNTAENMDNFNLEYIKKIVSQVMGEDIWNGFCDVVTTERPRIDMYDAGSRLLILGEIPGILTPGEVSISVSGGKLYIRGIARDKYQNSKPGMVLKSECIYGAFERVLDLPYPVDENNISASYENGILEITMQRASVDNGRTIKVDFKK